MRRYKYLVRQRRCGAFFDVNHDVPCSRFIDHKGVCNSYQRKTMRGLTVIFPSAPRKSVLKIENLKIGETFVFKNSIDRHCYMVICRDQYVQLSGPSAGSIYAQSSDNLPVRRVEIHSEVAYED